MTKDRHVPSGELHLVPSDVNELTSGKVDFYKNPRGGRRVRLSLSPRERQALKPGEHPAEVAKVLGRPVIIIKGAFGE
jgi:hypothetical protein